MNIIKIQKNGKSWEMQIFDNGVDLDGFIMTPFFITVPYNQVEAAIQKLNPDHKIIRVTN